MSTLKKVVADNLIEPGLSASQIDRGSVKNYLLKQYDTWIQNELLSFKTRHPDWATQFSFYDFPPEDTRICLEFWLKPDSRPKRKAIFFGTMNNESYLCSPQEAYLISDFVGSLILRDGSNLKTRRLGTDYLFPPLMHEIQVNNLLPFRK